MPIATVTPKFVNAPKDQKNYGSINCDGTYYSFDVRKIRTQEFNKGEPVTIEYTESPSGDRTFYNITRLIKNEQAPASNGNNGAAAPKPAPVSTSRMSPEESAKITRLAIAKSCIEAGKDTTTAEVWLAWVNKTPENQF